MKNLGIVLIVIGIAMMIVTGVNLVTREKIVDVGPLKVTTKKDNPINWSPIVGGLILVAGVVVVATNKKG